MAPTFDWNRTDVRVSDDGSWLVVNLFNSAPLAVKGEGKFKTGEGNSETTGEMVVGRLVGKSLTFTPLQNGKISFTYSRPKSARRSASSDVFWPEHAAIFQIKLVKDNARDEAKDIARTPLAIQVGGKIVVRENSNGVYVNIERPATRLEPEEAQKFDVFSYEYGLPTATLPKGLTLQTEINNDAADEEGGPATSPTTIFSAALSENSIGPGRFPLQVKAGPAVPEGKMPALRIPLDSLLCFVTATAKEKDYLVGEAMTLSPARGPATPPFLSLILWQNHRVKAPTWENIEPIMQMYARLFPGMVSILDISDLDTVKANAAVLKNRFERDRKNPGFMPVSRDMSPTTVKMVVEFLKPFVKE